MKLLQILAPTIMALLAACVPNGGIKVSDEGLSREEAGKTTFTLMIRSADWLFPSGAQGSGVIILEDEDYLYGITNLHNFGLDDLAGRWFQRDLTQFEGAVVFHNGEAAPVEAFGMIHPRLDIAHLIIPKEGSRRGKEYETIVLTETLEPSPGDPVLAIGSPMGLPNTYTRGHLSAFRSETITQDKDVLYLQTDTAINPGNSGGPLFLEKEDRYFWLGINTMGVVGSEGLNFAIHHSEINAGEVSWYPMTPEGATEAVAAFRELE